MCRATAHSLHFTPFGHSRLNAFLFTRAQFKRRSGSPKIKKKQTSYRGGKKGKKKKKVKKKKSDKLRGFLQHRLRLDCLVWKSTPRLSFSIVELKKDTPNCTVHHLITCNMLKKGVSYSFQGTAQTLYFQRAQKELTGETCVWTPHALSLLYAGCP